MERLDRKLVAAHGRMEGKMAEDRKAAERKRNEILELLGSNRATEAEEGTENRHVTIQTQAQSPEQVLTNRYPVQPFSFPPLSDAILPLQR